LRDWNEEQKMEERGQKVKTFEDMESVIASANLG